MLREFTDVSQQRGVKGKRRWFSDNEMDLIVWYTEDDKVTGFQLCYDRGGHERAFTWKADGTMTHDAVDGGESSPIRNDSPVLVHGKEPPSANVLVDFRERAQELPHGVAELVERALTAYVKH